MKKILWFLLGVATTAAGFYVLNLRSNVLQPTTPANLAILVKQAIDANDLSAVQNLMIPQQRSKFTSGDMNSIRQYIQVGTSGEAGSSINDYVVMTFGNHQSITMFLAQPIGQDDTWHVAKIIEGANLAPAN